MADYIVEQWNRIGGDDWKNDRKWPVVAKYDSRLSWVRSNSREPPGERKIKNRVVVVFVAAQPTEVDESRKWRYEVIGETDWRPFGNKDDSETIEDYVRKIFSTTDNATLHPYAFERFCAVIKKKGLRELVEFFRCPIIILVDPWTVYQLEQYKRVMRAFTHLDDDDRRMVAKPIIIWNTASDDDVLKIQGTFKKDINNLFNGFYEETISPAYLGSRLNEAVDSLKLELRNLRPRERKQDGSRPPQLNAN